MIPLPSIGACPALTSIRSVKAIISFEIDVREIDNVFKLSQNRDQPSYDTIIQQLDARDGDARIIAEEMRKRRTQLFAPKQVPEVPV